MHETVTCCNMIVYKDLLIVSYTLMSRFNGPLFYVLSFLYIFSNESNTDVISFDSVRAAAFNLDGSVDFNPVISRTTLE